MQIGKIREVKYLPKKEPLRRKKRTNPNAPIPIQLPEREKVEAPKKENVNVQA